jgi:uncharacterized lipoprotein YmbA
VLPTTTTRVNLTIDQLHGDGRGSALLVAYWDIETGGKISSFEFAQRQTLASDGYTALVQAEEALLQQLAAAIAATIKPG